MNPRMPAGSGNSRDSQMRISSDFFANRVQKRGRFSMAKGRGNPFRKSPHSYREEDMANPSKKDRRSATKPHFEKAERELWLGETLVKRFRQPAVAQEQILLAFQERLGQNHRRSAAARCGLGPVT